MITPMAFSDYCERWLTEAGLCYGRGSREAFVRAHPCLFGRAYEVSLRGYERWLLRCNARDDLGAFATYLTLRFQHPTMAGRLEFTSHEHRAHAIDVQQMIECGLIGEHDMRWAHLCRQPEHSRDALAMTCNRPPQAP
jgi:hypothetical protein